MTVQTCTSSRCLVMVSVPTETHWDPDSEVTGVGLRIPSGGVKVPLRDLPMSIPLSGSEEEHRYGKRYTEISRRVVLHLRSRGTKTRPGH